MRSKKNWLRGASLICLAGCMRTLVGASVVSELPKGHSTLDFWEGIEGERVLSNDDALHGLFLLAEDSEVPTSYAERVTAARVRGWLGPRTAPPAEESAQFGLIAKAVSQILELKGGVTMRLFGPSGRYCTRELPFYNLAPLRSEYQSISGLEFIDLASRAQDFRLATGEEPVRGTP